MSMRALLLDIDGVVVPEGQLYFSDALRKEFDIPSDVIAPFFREHFIECLKGKKDIRQELKEYLKEKGFDVAIDEIIHDWIERERALDTRILGTLVELRSQGVACFLASNQVKERAEFIWNDLSLKDYCDGAFFSCDLGFVKTEKEFFEAVLTRLKDYEAKDILLVDDTRAIVENAEALGFKVHHYTKFSAFKNELLKLFPEDNTKEIAAILKLGLTFDPPLVPNEITPVRTSSMSKVYELLVPDREPLMIQLNSFLPRAALYEMTGQVLGDIRSQGIPAPEVVSVGTDPISFAYIMYKKIPGMTADVFPGDKSAIWRKAGEYARHINSFAGPGYGRLWYWENNPQTHYDTWQEYITKEMARITHPELDPLLEPEHRELMREIIDRIEPMREWRFPARLIHGDLILDNIIVDDAGDIQGIIDWDEMRFARAPHHELAFTTAWISEQERNEFLAGYGISRDEWRDMQTDIEMIQLLMFADYFLFYNRIGDETGMQQIEDKIRQIL
jgi:HAD superfamily hydrolase (TIGR01509 family)